MALKLRLAGMGRDLLEWEGTATWFAPLLDRPKEEVHYSVHARERHDVMSVVVSCNGLDTKIGKYSRLRYNCMCAPRAKAVVAWRRRRGAS